MLNAKIYELLPDNKCVAVDENKKSYTATIKGSLKKERLYVGDNIFIEEKSGTYVANKVLPRKNWFIRPPVSNIDYMIIVQSIKEPNIDYLLLDKQILLCKSKNITPIILITKKDLMDKSCQKEYDYINNVYKKLGIEIYIISSFENELLTDIIKLKKGKVYTLSGSSGVGKSTIVKNITGDISIETTDVSEKTNRGRHTTKYVKIYELDGAYLLDTPGFSSFELGGVIEAKKLKYYYDDFLKEKCIYDDCNHILEEECNVKKAVINGKIDSLRYERYVKLYNDLKLKDDLKYKR